MTVFQPTQFGKYQLLDKIAVGGMAELFRAKLTGVQGFEKLMAIKKILPNLSEEENLITSFIDEAKLAALLHHENIVQIYDFGSIDNEYFIAMEFLFGKDLRIIRQTAKKRDLPLGIENILYIVARICAGLDYSHNLKDLQGQPLNIIHRDINPQNIFVTYEGQVKIIDFGIAKAANHNTKTRENLIKGKLAYMSPEQANGQTIDHRSDIFSTGIILYELLAVKRMFEGETMHVLSLVREAQYDPPEEVIPNLPPKLNDILRRALAKDPNDRYQSAGDMLADVEECAFELSLRPNARNFAHYMKELFEEEFVEEELALWAKSKIYEAGENETEDSAPAIEETYDNTIVLTRAFLNEKLAQFKQVLFKRIWQQLAKILQVTKRNSDQKSKPSKKPGQRRFKSAGLVPGLAVIAFLVVVAIGIKQISFSRSQPEASTFSSPSTPVTEASEISKLTAAKAALEAKRYTLATTLIEEIIASKPSMMSSVSDVYIKALQGQAADLVKTDSEQAEKLLAKALKMDPGNVSVLSNLGYTFMVRKNYPKAIETYLKVADLAPQLPDTFFNLGYVYAVTKDYQQAKQMYLRVVELAPTFTDEALFNLAVINEKLGEHKQSIKNLEQAVSLNPRNESAKRYLQRLKKKTGAKG
ncbi:MAG: protein kinase [Desulfobacterales bacterium]|nr:MAG: protein kinase [Desulfobacterales bacterium]